MNEPATPKNTDLAFALDVVKQAECLIMGYFDKGVPAHVKFDGSFVTQADQEAERLIRDAIECAFPSDNILGEEHGEGAYKQSSRKWIIDPIDGTYNFIRGIPSFSTLLALEEGGEISLGIVNVPTTGETFWASRGEGAYKNGQPVRVSHISNLSESQINFGLLRHIQKEKLWEGVSELIGKTYWQRCGGDYLNFTYVFEGKSEASLEVGVQPWDLAPMKILAEEAGGRFSDLQGDKSIYTGSCLVSNGLVHEACLSLIMQPPRC